MKHPFPKTVPGTSRATWRSAVATIGLLAAIACAPVYGQGAAPTLLSPAAAPSSAKSQSPDLAVVRQKPVGVNFESLGAPAGDKPKQMSVELFDGQIVTINLDRLERRGATDYTWHGRIQGDPSSQVILTVVNGQLAGSVVLGDGGPKSGGSYQIQSGADGVHWLRQIDQRAFPPDHPPGDNGALPPPFQTSSPWGTADTIDPLASTSVADTVASGATIDVMVVYSNKTAAAAGTAIGAQIQQAIDTANTVYANSGITARLRLVHYEQVNYNDSGSFPTDLNRLTSTTDGYMDNVHALRNTYGADMVSLFVENMQYCGYGWIGSSASKAFSVINRSCASGNYSFPHELGHNFGTRHDTYVDSSTSPYAYGHGWVDVAQGWRDVMAYNDACAAVGKSCTRIPYLSNPNLTYGNPPNPLGSSTTADNARVHNNNATTIASFRPTANGCTYGLSPTSASAAVTGGSGSFNVTAGTGCAWNSTTSASWLSIAAGSGTTDSGTLNYAVAANTGPTRSATITVGGQAFTVNQASGCTYSLSPSSASFVAGGGTGSTTLGTGASCTWSASSSASWLTITSATSGTGGATVGYSVAANTSSARSANLTVGGVTLMVTQDAAPAVATPAATLSSTSVAFGSQKVGTTSAPKSVTLTNSGAGTLTISSMSKGGPNPGDFLDSPACTLSTALASGQSCTLQYAFKPAASGKRSAQVSIGTNAGTVTLSVSGQGSRK